MSKQFQDGDEIIYAVDNVSFSCAPQQFVTIAGPSGCGKSTLLYLLGSLEQPTDGRLIVDGVEVTELSSNELNYFRRSRIGFVFQSFHLVPNLSALENVMLPMDVAGVPAASRLGVRGRCWSRWASTRIGTTTAPASSPVGSSSASPSRGHWRTIPP